MEQKLCDIHMHLIHGVDDGAMDLNVAIGMLMKAREQGVRAVFATSHSSAYDVWGEEAREHYESLRSAAARFFPEMELCLGCEVRCESDNMGSVKDALKSGTYPTLNGTRYVLTEFSTRVEPEAAIARAKELVKDGWIPVIAHMERYKTLHPRGENGFDMRLARQLKALGCKIQINVCSLLEEPDAAIRDCARRLVKERLVDFLGSDAHNTSDRPPSVRSGLDWLYATCGEVRGYIDDIAWNNAYRLLIKKENQEETP